MPKESKLGLLRPGGSIGACDPSERKRSKSVDLFFSRDLKTYGLGCALFVSRVRLFDEWVGG